ncbi:MAG: ATP-binding protein [Anaerolineales bacterium]
MPAAFQQFFNLLITPPGNFIYHLILAFSISSALPIAVYLWKSNLQPLNNRVTLGLAILLFLRLVLFTSGGFIWQGILADQAWQPVFERAIAMLSLVILVWLWAFPLPNPRGDIAFSASFLFFLVCSLFMSVWWSSQPQQNSFNGSFPDRLFTIIIILINLFAILILARKRPPQWTSAVLFFLILLSGYFVHFLNPLPEQDYSPYIRFVELAAYPLLILLPLRFPLQEIPSSSLSQTIVPAIEKTITPHELSLIESSLKLPFDFQTGQLGHKLPQIIAQAMRADICLLVSTPDESGQITLHGGYDLIREKPLEGGSWDGKAFPTLTAALRHGKNLRLYADTTAPDLANLASTLHLDKVGNLLTATIFDQENQPIYGILLISPYSDHRWIADEQDYLVHITTALSATLDYLRKQAETAALLVETEQSLIQAQENLTALQQELQARPMFPPEETPKSPEPAPASPITTLEGELHLALEEIAHLRSQLEKYQTDLLTLQNQTKGGEGANLIASLATDLRQPLASILGYTDFLLSESVGILGALQRKFLERIRNATQRANSILEEYIPKSSLSPALSQTQAETLDLLQLIPTVLEKTSPQREAKSQQIQLGLPQQLPPLYTDHSAMEQILHKLVENAILATPPQRQISLQVELKQEDEQPRYYLLQVHDQGGGIRADALAHVFSPIRQEIPRGLGLSGSDLYIVKTLVETLNGRIWVDSTLGKGTTFSILLPFRTPSSDQEGKVKGQDENTQ